MDTIRDQIKQTRIESSVAVWANDMIFISGYRQIEFIPQEMDLFEAQILADIFSMTSIKKERTELVAVTSSQEAKNQPQVGHNSLCETAARTRRAAKGGSRVQDSPNIKAFAEQEKGEI